MYIGCEAGVDRPRRLEIEKLWTEKLQDENNTIKGWKLGLYSIIHLG